MFESTKSPRAALTVEHDLRGWVKFDTVTTGSTHPQLKLHVVSTRLLLSKMFSYETFEDNPNETKHWASLSSVW